MKAKEFSKSIAEICKETMNRRGISDTDIKINYLQSYVSVGVDGCEFFAQGEAAIEIMAEAIRMSKETNLSTNTCLIAYLNSSGVL